MDFSKGLQSSAFLIVVDLLKKLHLLDEVLLFLKQLLVLYRQLLIDLFQLLNLLDDHPSLAI